MIYYKFLKEDRRASFVNGFQWPKPPNKPDPVIGNLVVCKNGYHLCRIEDLPHWLNQELWIVGCDETELIESNNKVVVRHAWLEKQVDTWNEKTARLFAADCAEHVLHLFESRYPDDKRPRNVIGATRDYAHGRISHDDMIAVWTASKNAAGRAEDAEDTAKIAAFAAAAAALDTSCAAAKAAAWTASRAAAWDASGAAWDASGVAWGAESDAWDAAWDAERQWQTQQLLKYINNEI